MKKLNQYLKNKRITSVALLTIFTIIFIFDNTLNYWGTHVNIYLKESSFSPSFVFGPSNIIYDPLGGDVPNEVFFGVLAFFISFINFKFLHKKSLALATLSFPKTRAQLFNKKTLLPLVPLLLSGIIAKTILLYWNWDFYGFSSNLLLVYIINVLTFIQYILMGFTLGIFGRLFTARTLEGFISSVCLIFIPKTIYLLIDVFAPMFLHGYYDFLATQNEAIMFFDPIRHFFANTINYSEVLIDAPVSYYSVAYSAFWIVLTSIALVLFKKYFIKYIEYEKTGINNKFPIITVMSSVTLPVAVVTFLTYGDFQYNRLLNEKYMILLVAFILAAISGYIINAIISKTLLFKKEKAITISLIIGLPLALLLITSTGGLGYESRIPDTEKIEKVTIRTSLSITENSIRPQYELNGCYSSKSYYSLYDSFLSSDNLDNQIIYNRLEFENFNDYKKIGELHKSAIESVNSETLETLLITYELKNGRTITREYKFLSEETVEKIFALWETETVKNTYKDWLLNADEIIESQKTAHDFNYEFNKIPLSRGGNVTIHSIDSVPTELTDLTEEEFLTLKSAIYNDIHSLSWEQWFKPAKTYGNISFTNTYSFKPLENQENVFDSDVEILDDRELFVLTLPVTSEMTHTVKFLEGIGVMDKFQRTREISKAYLVDTEDCAKMWFSTYGNKDRVENKADFYHSVLFDSTTKELPITSNSFSHPYYDGTLNSISREVSGEELEALLEKANTRYYCGTDSDLLLVWSFDLTNDTYVISK